MLSLRALGAATLVLACTSAVLGLGSSCSGPIGPGTSGQNDPFWMESIKHQGKSAFNPNPNVYSVFRNVKDFGARGDGVTDDTAAINAAITSGGRCGGGGCRSSTLTPAVVYFPKGTYLVSAPIIPYYYTQLIGDAKNFPTILASASFDGMAVIDANPYIPGGGGAQYWTNQNNFHKSIRNFVIDVRRVPADKPQGTGIHWQVAQATSLMNIVIQMSAEPNTAHQGIWMENGSGGYMGDLVFNGGKFGIWGGNQQFTVKNVTFNNVQTAVYSLWNWGWTYQGVTINNAQVGFDIASGGLTIDTQTTGAQAIIDAVVTNTQIFVRNSQPSNGRLAGSLVLNNVRLNNVPVAVGVVGGAVVLNGGSTTISSWGQGNIYRGTNPSGSFIQGNIPAPNKDASLLDSAGRIVARTHPQYAEYAVNQFISVKDYGAVGDGFTDDTAALTSIFNRFSGCKIIFFDAGTYVVSNTITIPAGTQMTGEAWTVLAGKGPAFQDQNNPRPVFRIGETGSQGVLEISDIVFSTIGPAAGAIIVEWNVRQPSGFQAGAGMWDSHVRTAGAAGTNLEGNRCPKSGAGGFDNCFAAYMALHLTPRSTAYIEGAWVWLADHDLDFPGEGQISVYSGRGILSESQGPVWLIGTAEHHVLYQYNLVNAANHYMGLIQTESPYYQPAPVSPSPFTINRTMKDPTPYSGNPSAWAVSITQSRNILIFGAGLYSFFDNYSQACIDSRNCQSQLLNIDTASTNINIYSLSTVATMFQVSVNGAGIVNQAGNVNGFASTVTSWSQ
ncbi:putative glucan endo-1,3-beta-glucosidase [Psilocybe cubensis]|uniref:Rhamnogalacturonase A/B/Epimerase-like pectate lyase domain-containing protein n=2 Tax=Psilocybe cubensis TaxID=181762 RepID=A0A8H7XLN5_PSICU|nr:putative glucan endo-1,3-beta-glucosidase [Psilocybe cubensis]KAH9476326.1 putative glucan endo-1,3-beta-glucosidase [Psilocybe cubensis]